MTPNLLTHIQNSVELALKEDIGSGDITAQLIAVDSKSNARVITREPAIIAGVEWVSEVFRQLDSQVKIEWKVKDGDRVEPEQVLFELSGSTRSLLTGERVALNFLQTLSAVATKTNHYVQKVSHTSVKLLDTRKTIPGLRLGQKYAVKCGGGENHRIGLYDAFLIKENHIVGCGSIENAVNQARKVAPGKPVEVEVENLSEFEQAINAGADIIMLDNFTNDDKKIAVNKNLEKGAPAKLEASGGITETTLIEVAETGVDFISIGTLTKDITAIDLSMRLNLS